MTGGKKNTTKLFRRRLHRWLDEWRLAASGIVLATRDRKFLLAAALTFVIFGTIMNLFSGSTASLDLFWRVGLAEKSKIIFGGFLGLFGIGHNFLDWLLIFSVTVLQSILIGLVALAWLKSTPLSRRPAAPRRKQSTNLAAAAEVSPSSVSNADNLSDAGLAAGLAVLGTGCPTCGTTLLAPLIGALFSTSGYALAGTVSGLLTAAAVIVALLTLKRLGNDAYARIISEKYHKRNRAQQKTQPKTPPKTQPKTPPKPQPHPIDPHKPQPKKEKSHA